jgi:acetate kinase
VKILISNPGSTSVKYAAYENSKKTLVKGFSPDKIAIRIVAPGSYFQENHVIDDKFIKKLKAVMELAPLHIGSCLLEINKLKKNFLKQKS